MQTAVLDTPPIGIAGQPADMFTSAHGDIRSYANSEASDAIPFGTMVGRGAAAGTALALNTANDVLLGIAVHSHYYTELQLGEVEDYPAVLPDVTFGVGRTGRYFVIIEEDVDFDDEVHVRAVATTGEIAGAFGKSDNGADSINLSDFCSWVADADVDDETGFGIAILDVNMALAPALQATDS